MKPLHRLFILGALIFLSIRTASAQVSITTWQHDLQHSGNNPQETALTPGNVSSPGNFGLLFSQPMDGQTYGQPLLASGINVGSTAHNIVYAATEHGSLYAFDADTNTGANASALWKVSLLPSGTMAVPQSAVSSSDIPSELGITTTPVIDLSSSTIYLVSKVRRTSDTTYHQYLYALDLATGATKFGSPVEINPTFPGSATPDSSGGVVPFNPLREHMRCAMILYNGVVYLTYASHGDTTPYHGEIVGYDAKTLQVVKTFITTPNGSNPEGGIWQAGAGPAVDGSGNLFVSVGNGAWDQTNSTYGTNWGESMLKLPTSGTFGVSYSNTLNWFTPNNWKTLNNGDLDLGSGGLTLLPDQAGPHTHIMVGGGKGAVLYVVDRDNLGGVNTPDNSIQEISEINGDWFFCTPAYYNGYLYYTAAGGPLEQRAVGYNPIDGSYISTTPVTSTDTIGNKGSGCFISSNGTTNGLVWLLIGSGIRVYDAKNVSGSPIYSASATVPNNVSCLNTKFSLPIVANGKLYYTAYNNPSGTSTYNGYLLIYGLLPSAVGTPVAPSNASAMATSSKTVTVTWTTNSTNESGFKIKRSTSTTGTFSQVGTVGAGVTTFADTGLSPSTAYYYQVVATNANGDSNATNVASATTFPTYTENGLVAYWNMDETSGSTVADATANLHTGTINGEAGLATGFINNAVNLHGTGQATSNVTVANQSDLQFTAAQSFTLSAWVLPQALRGSEETIIAKSRDQGNYYGIWLNASSQWVFRGPTADVVGSTATEGSWTHVAVVQDGTVNTRKLYVNGVLVGRGTAQAADGAGALWMAQQNISGNYESFPGSLDEVRLYSRALAAGEITNLMGPPVLAASSNQTQGNSGTFGVNIWPITNKVIEPRKGSTAGQYNLVLNFSAPVSGVSATLQTQGGTAAVGSAGTVSYDSTKRVVTIPLTGVGNAQALNLHLTGITPGNGTADLPFNVLWGDVNGDNIVSALDLSIVQNNHATLVGGTTAQYDLNGDGVVNSADDSVVSAAVGTNLGPQTDTNLAQYQTASASSVTSSNNAALAFDNNTTTTRWESVQGTSADPSWITVDLGGASTIHQVILNWEIAAGKTYTVDVSNDGLHPEVQNGTNWTHLATETGNTYASSDGSNPHPPYVSTLSGTYRYVRMFGLTRLSTYGYSLWDFKVVGLSGSGAPAAPTVNSSTSASATTGVAFTYQITATSSPTSYNATGLPSGLSVNTSTGVISGTPTQTGSFNVALTATNAGGSGTATLALIVQTPFNAWQNVYFTAAELKNSTVSGPNATPAGDGITNLMKYALNLNPKVNGTAGLPVESMTTVGAQRYLTLTFTKVVAATDITYLVEVSGDLQTWVSGASNTVTVSTTNSADGKTQTVVVRDLTATSGAVKRFIHLKVTEP